MLEPIHGHSRWLNPPEPKSDHLEDCPLYADPDAQLFSEEDLCIGCFEDPGYRRALAKERREKASDHAADLAVDQQREERDA